MKQQVTTSDLTDKMLNTVIFNKKTLLELLVNECTVFAFNDLKVYTTKNHDMFGFLEQNRNVNPAHVNALVNSFERDGYLFSILYMNEKLEVIDGQHRLMAAKETGNEVYFIIMPGWGMSEVITLNLKASNWNMDDFMESYAKAGVPDYVRLSEVKDLCGLTVNKLLQMVSGHKRSGELGDKFRSGQFKFSSAQSSALTTKILAALQIKEIHPKGWSSVSCLVAISRLMDDKGFDFSQLIDKLRRFPGYPDDSLKEATTLGSADAYITRFIAVYNYHRRDGKFHLKYGD